MRYDNIILDKANKFLTRYLLAILSVYGLSGCAQQNDNVVLMSSSANEMDGDIIVAIAEYVRNGNLDNWPYLKSYDRNPIISTMSAGKMTEEIIASAIHIGEKEFGIHFSSALIQELKARNIDHVPLSDYIPNNSLLLTSNIVVKPWLMDSWGQWNKNGYFSIFLPAYFNFGSNAILVAWTGPSLNGGIATFYLCKSNNTWHVRSGYANWFM